MAVVPALLNQAALEHDRGEPGTADILLAEAHEIASRIGVPLLSQPVLQAMGEMRRRQGEWRGAFDLYEESLRCWQQGGDVLDLVPLLVPFADVARHLGEDALVLRLLDVIEGLQCLGLHIPRVHQDIYCAVRRWADRGEPAPRASLSGPALKDHMCGIFDETTSVPRLSGRERAVLDLLVDGHTNTQMAERLFVSPHTINTHVRRIYQKLGVNTRSAATRVAIERGMVAGTQGVT